MAMGYREIVNRFSTTRFGSWLGRTTSARIDPWLYRVSKGRFTSTGVPTVPQLVLTTTGRKSGQPRSVQLGYLADADDYVVVASNFGQERHPAWSYNLAAEPDASVDIDGRTVGVTSHELTGADKDAIWPRLDEVVPQFQVYRTRTDRDIRIYRLVRSEPAGDTDPAV